MNKKVVITCITTILLLSTFMVGIVKSDSTTYSDITLIGGFIAGHFDEIWDLTAGDIEISFTYDANGLVDDAGCHAWAELGVRSVDTASDFNPYWRIIDWTYSCGPATLYADQNIPIGSVTCTGDEGTLVIEYELDDPWLMCEAHVHVATSLNDIPQIKGNPIPGKFMINVPYDPPIDGDSFSIDLSTIPGYTPGATLYIAAHAIVSQTVSDSKKKTAWGYGVIFPGKNWATYMTCTPTPVKVAGSGVWLATDYDWTVNTFNPDPPNAPTLDLDDKLILQRVGGHGEGDYNLPSTPPAPGNNHRVWWDRDGVDPYQNSETANTEGIYQIIITLHATSSTTGTAYMNIRGLDQGFETDGNWNTIELSPAGMTFTGDMQHLQVFYGLYGYGATHTVIFTDITVTQ